MIKSIDVNMSEFLREIDHSIEQSRAAFSMWDAVHIEISTEQWDAVQLKAVERGETDCPICLNELQLSVERCDKSNNIGGNHSTVEADNNSKSSGSFKLHKFQDRKSQDKKLLTELSRRAIPTGTDISFLRNTEWRDDPKTNKVQSSTPVVSTDSMSLGKTESGNSRTVRSTVLLSCSHVFHSTCLKTLEDLAMVDMKNTCPVCRAHYQKKILVF
ncbi:hypothetical protein Btru_054652 [Bulinus truncatus]|nr:hypothetical protein Btru_054652 [Bulinus truncatus]